MIDPKVISYRMSRIRGRDTSIELLLRKALWQAGLRYRVHLKSLPGTPDIAFPGAKIAVFCDSSFWHGQNWEAKKKKLRTNRDYWITKIERNMARDVRVTNELRSQGWRVLRFWDSEINGDLQACIDRIGYELNWRAPATEGRRRNGARETATTQVGSAEGRSR